MSGRFHTEKEAAEMWCPWAGGKRVGQPKDINCLSSKCICWRWAKYPTTGEKQGWCGNPSFPDEDGPAHG